MNLKINQNGSAITIPLQSSAPTPRLAVRYNNTNFYAPPTASGAYDASPLRVRVGNFTYAISNGASVLIALTLADLADEDPLLYNAYQELSQMDDAQKIEVASSTYGDWYYTEVNSAIDIFAPYRVNTDIYDENKEIAFNTTIEDDNIEIYGYVLFFDDNNTFCSQMLEILAVESYRCYIAPYFVDEYLNGGQRPFILLLGHVQE